MNIELMDDIIEYICDFVSIDSSVNLRLVNKTFKQFISIKFDTLKIISFINNHYSINNLELMHTIGLILHTKSLRQKIRIDKEILLKYLNFIPDKKLCHYTTLYRSVKVITTHSVILNLLS